MKHNIELYSDQLEDIVWGELDEALMAMEEALRCVEGGDSCGVYSFIDEDLEKKELKKTIKAYKRVIREWEIS